MFSTKRGAPVSKIYRKNEKKITWKIAEIVQKFEQLDFTIHDSESTQKMQMEWQTMWTLIWLFLQEQSDLGLHCLPRIQ